MGTALELESGLAGQVPKSAAEIYDAFFLPALFQDWGPRVADAAEIGSGQQVLDVACGTGALLRVCAERTAPEGLATGLDRNEAMLEVARKKFPAVSLQPGMAENLPFETGAFDRVVSQFGLMFFEEPVAALNEMWRVLRPGGRLAVAVWGSLEDTPGYAAMAALLQRLFGVEIARELEAPYSLGDRSDLLAMFAEAGIPDARLETLTGTARFSSIEDWVYTDIKGWTLADSIDDAQYDRLLAAAGTDLKAFVTADGSVSFDAPAHIVTATKA